MQSILWFLCVCVTWIWCNIKNLKRLEFLYRSNVLEPQEDSHVNVQLSIFISFSALETCIPRPFLKTPRSEYWKKETALSPIEPSRFWPALVLGGVRTVLGAFFFRESLGWAKSLSNGHDSHVPRTSGTSTCQRSRDDQAIQQQWQERGRGRRKKGKWQTGWRCIYIYKIDFLLSSLFRGNDPIWRGPMFFKWVAQPPTTKGIVNGFCWRDFHHQVTEILNYVCKHMRWLLSCFQRVNGLKQPILPMTSQIGKAGRFSGWKSLVGLSPPTVSPGEDRQEMAPES